MEPKKSWTRERGQGTFSSAPWPLEGRFNPCSLDTPPCPNPFQPKAARLARKDASTTCLSFPAWFYEQAKNIHVLWHRGGLVAVGTAPADEHLQLEPWGAHRWGF